MPSTTPSASYVAIASALQLRMVPVASIGKVHTYQRDIRDPESFKTNFFDVLNKREAGWTISRRSFTDRQLSNIENERRSIFVLRGYMVTNDARMHELIFQQVVDDVARVFRPQEDLTGLVEKIDPVQAPTIGYTNFGNFTVHFAELTIMIQERYNSTL